MQRKRDRIFNDRFQHLRKEIRVAYMLKHIRVFKALFKKGMSADQWKAAFSKFGVKYYEKSKVPQQEETQRPVNRFESEDQEAENPPLESYREQAEVEMLALAVEDSLPSMYPSRG